MCQVVSSGDRGEWLQVVFPGRPLRVGQRGCLFARRYPRKLVLWKSFVLCRRKSASNVVLRAGPASVWRQRTVVVSAQEIPFATETWRGVVCWRGGMVPRVARRWWWCCCGGGGGGGSESGKWLAAMVFRAGGVGSGQLTRDAGSAAAFRGESHESESTFGVGPCHLLQSSSTSTTQVLAKGALGEAFPSSSSFFTETHAKRLSYWSHTLQNNHAT